MTRVRDGNAAGNGSLQDESREVVSTGEQVSLEADRYKETMTCYRVMGRGGSGAVGGAKDRDPKE